ncbi:uncharacterized protein bahd1 [Aplochiton taeniatus]
MVRAWPNQKATRGRPRKIKIEKRGGVKERKGGTRKDRGAERSERKKKCYVRRRRTLSVADGDTLDCRVLLTRIEEKAVMASMEKKALKSLKKKNLEGKACHNHNSVIRRTKPIKSRGKNVTAHQETLHPKNDQSDALRLILPNMEPRKRRMASLNAEAVNSLLLFKENPLRSQHAKKHQNPNAGLPKVELTKGKADSKETITKAKHVSKSLSGTKRGPPVEKSCVGEKPKKQKKAKKEAESIDWLQLLTPTPRRQAGLTAAALLKLTGTSSGSKRHTKADCATGKEVASPTQTSCKPLCAGAAQTKKTPLKQKQKVTKRPLRLLPSAQGPSTTQAVSQLQNCCSVCKRASVDPEAKKNSGVCGQPGLQRRAMEGFRRKHVKEEQVEADVPRCYCCSHDRCVEYCRRLALFLGEKSFEEPAEGSQSTAYHHHHHHHHHHHLPSPYSLSHPAALTLSPHPYTCFPGYFVHFTHPDSSSASSLPYPPNPPPSPAPPITLCPGEVQRKRPKLLPSPSPSPSPSGIPRPVYCTSIGTCYGEPRTISGYAAYTAAPAITNRRCCYSAGCNSCSHAVKIEDCPSCSLKEHGPTSIPICPSPRPLTGCPVPTVPSAGQSVPHKQTPLSDPSQPQPPLQVARECPQSAKAPSGSRSGACSSAGRSSSVCSLSRDKKPKPGLAKARGASAKQSPNGRRKATNGWQPVGEPFEKEVFTVGEEAPVPRKCFEGVQRDEDVIWVRDTVLLRSGPRKKSLPYVAKISAFWEDTESGEMMMSLFWYYRPEHTQGGHIPNMHCENEIFASRHQDVNSVACIEDKCYVLTVAQYCRFCALVKRRKEGVLDSATSFMVPPVVDHTLPAHRCVPADVDPDLVYVCRHVYDFRYGRILKNLQ